MADQPEKMPLTSMDIAEERREELQRLFPEVFREGKIDFDALKRSLGEWVEPGKERFGLNWPGKAACMQAIQSPSVGTLLPKPEESVNWDTTENLIIEGDNLEVLKLLQTAYHGKVKMIYIDPPYNTGNDFIYPDDYAESLQTYLEYTGQVDSEGRKYSTNTEADGRFHTKWINMMFPRLYLARNLLKNDGVIFVSIDDQEVSNLRQMMDEVFGAENFVATVIWQKVFSPKNTARHFSEDHDYVVVYARSGETWQPELLPRTEEADARYSNPDDDPRGPWTSGDLSARNFYGEGTYSVTCPSGRVIEGPPAGRYWAIRKSAFLDLDKDNRIWWGEDGDNMPRLKRFLSEVKQGRVPQTLWTYKEVGHTQEAKKELLKRVTFASSDSVFETPKPTRLIQQMLRIGTSKDDGDIILDFFAGSGSTGEGVMKLNAEDGGNRRFILVQLPERTGAEDFETISDMTKARLRAAVEAIPKEVEGGDADLGFRVLSLAPSNFKVWEGDAAKAADMPEALSLFADHVVEGRTGRDMLYEILLKAGFPLTAPIETLELAGKDVFSVAEGALLVCLEKEITLETVEAMVANNPQQIICLDAGFQGNDQLKVNAVQTVKARNRSEETDMVFKVV